MIGSLTLLLATGLAAGLATSPADSAPAGDTRSGPPVLPAEDSASTELDPAPTGVPADAERQADTERQADAEREAFLARQPKDLRHPFLLARRPTPRAGGRVEQDLKDPFVGPRSSNAGSESVPADLRDPFQRAAPMPPVEFPAPNVPMGRCADDMPGLTIQRPRALQQELCGTAEVEPTLREGRGLIAKRTAASNRRG